MTPPSASSGGCSKPTDRSPVPSRESHAARRPHPTPCAIHNEPFLYTADWRKPVNEIRSAPPGCAIPVGSLSQGIPDATFRLVSVGAVAGFWMPMMIEPQPEFGLPTTKNVLELDRWFAGEALRAAATHWRDP